MVHVGVVVAEVVRLPAEQVIDEHGHVADVDLSVAVHVSRIDDGLGLDFLYLEGEVVGIQGEQIVAAVPRQVVGAVVVALACAVLGAGGDDDVGCGAIAVGAVERGPVVVPLLGPSVGKHEVDGRADGQCIHIGAIAQVAHLP